MTKLAQSIDLMEKRMLRVVEDTIGKLKDDIEFRTFQQINKERTHFEDLITMTRERIMDTMNVTDRVDWRISRLEQSKRQHIQVNLGEWLYKNDT